MGQVGNILECLISIAARKSEEVRMDQAGNVPERSIGPMTNECGLWPSPSCFSQRSQLRFLRHSAPPTLHFLLQPLANARPISCVRRSFFVIYYSDLIRHSFCDIYHPSLLRRSLYLLCSIPHRHLLASSHLRYRRPLFLSRSTRSAFQRCTVLSTSGAATAYHSAFGVLSRSVFFLRPRPPPPFCSTGAAGLNVGIER